MTRSPARTPGRSSPSRARTAAVATPKTAFTTTRMSIVSMSARFAWRLKFKRATAATAAPVTPSKAISASTTWASRWISSAARSMTPSPPRLSAWASALNPAVAIGNGQLGITVSDNTVFQVAARYTIGPWKLFGGYEHINFANPNNALVPGAFLQGGFIASTVNNTNFPTDKVLQTAWVGVRYAITPALDVTGAYYHEWQNTTSPLRRSGSWDTNSLELLRHTRRSLVRCRLALRQARRSLRRRDVVAGQWRSCEQLHRRPGGHHGAVRWPEQFVQLRSGHWYSLPVLI